MRYQIDIFQKSSIWEIKVYYTATQCYIKSNNIFLIKVNQPLSEALSHIFNKIYYTVYRSKYIYKQIKYKTLKMYVYRNVSPFGLFFLCKSLRHCYGDICYCPKCKHFWKWESEEKNDWGSKVTILGSVMLAGYIHIAVTFVHPYHLLFKTDCGINFLKLF